jgi:uncharacterized membrane protein YphA (DoxX/SURF4 family)
MNRAISTVFALFIGFFTLLFSLVLAIPLTIAAILTGKKLQKNLKMNPNFSAMQQNRTVLEGEYEDVSK